MIKNVIIDYPEFGNGGLKREVKFNKGINIIEEENGWGKSVILNTIISLYTKKFVGLRTLPKGFASIETDTGKYNLVKQNWIGIEDSNELYQYCIMGKFFDLPTTVKQREVLINLLDLNYDEYLVKELSKITDEYYSLAKTHSEKDISGMIREAEAQEGIILEDITRYKAQLIEVDNLEFDDIIQREKQIALLQKQIMSYNRNLGEKKLAIMREGNDLRGAKRDIENSIRANKLAIQNYSRIYEQLKLDRIKTKEDSKCNECGSALAADILKDRLDKIQKNGKNMMSEIEKLDGINAELESNLYNNSLNIDNVEKKLDAYEQPLDSEDPLRYQKEFNFNIDYISDAKLEKYEQHKELMKQQDFIKEQLRIKEDQLKKIDTVKLESNLDKLKEIKSLFTKHLQEKVSALPIDIELYKLQKNGEYKETFTIKKDGIDYSNLSQGNKVIVQILLAKIFVDKLGLDFILCDEVSVISKGNLKTIKELAKDYQVIVCKAKSWHKKDLQSNK